MSRQELREQLARLAEDAPVASVPDDTYRRGRRARARVRIAAAVAAAGCVVLGALAVGPALRSTGPQVADTDVPTPTQGIPDHIYDYRGDRSAANRSAPPFPETVAAYVTGGPAADGSQIVLVSAAGEYRLVPFPVDRPWDQHGDDFALSPDGTELAWASTDFSAKRNHLTVMQLRDGTTRSVTVGGPAPTHSSGVQHLVWSPDSSALMWKGSAVDRWGANTFEYGIRYGGGVFRVGPGHLSAVPYRGHVPWRNVTACDGGRVVGTLLDVRHSGCTYDSISLRPTGNNYEELRFADRPIARVELGIVGLTVATDYLRADPPSHDVAPPPWADRPDRTWPLVGVTAAVLAAGAAGGVWWRRRRPTQLRRWNL